MSRQLNVRVNDEFAARLEQLARKTGRSMGALIEELGGQAIEDIEQDMRFEAAALQAWEQYQLDGESVSTQQLDAMFAQAQEKARGRLARKQQ